LDNVITGFNSLSHTHTHTNTGVRLDTGYAGVMFNQLQYCSTQRYVEGRLEARAFDLTGLVKFVRLNPFLNIFHSEAHLCANGGSKLYFNL